MFFWMLALIIGAFLWGLETYLRKQDEKEQARLRAQAQRLAAAKRAGRRSYTHTHKRPD